MPKFLLKLCAFGKFEAIITDGWVDSQTCEVDKSKFLSGKVNDSPVNIIFLNSTLYPQYLNNYSYKFATSVL